MDPSVLHMPMPEKKRKCKMRNKDKDAKIDVVTEDARLTKTMMFQHCTFSVFKQRHSLLMCDDDMAFFTHSFFCSHQCAVAK